MDLLNVSAFPLAFSIKFTPPFSVNVKDAVLKLQPKEKTQIQVCFPPQWKGDRQSTSVTYGTSPNNLLTQFKAAK